MAVAPERDWAPLIAGARNASEQWQRRADELAIRATAPWPWPEVPPSLTRQIAAATNDPERFNLYDQQGKAWRARAEYLARYPLNRGVAAATATPRPSVPPSVPTSTYRGGGGAGSGVAVQCRGTTKSGARCQRMTTNASGYCFQH